MNKIKHLGIIMDGNRRWARANQKKSYQGHLEGKKTLEKVLNWCKESNISILTLYTFSAENWQRPKQEVDFLMKTFYHVFTKDIKRLHEKNIQVRVIGRLKGLALKLQTAIIKAMELTKNNDGSILNLAINYSGRLEIIDAFSEIFKKTSNPKEITEKLVSKYLYTADLPDPDLIIRTSGEQRVSGFLLWQAAYSELMFVKSCWPEFSKQDFDQAISCYYNRQRRFGC